MLSDWQLKFPLIFDIYPTLFTQLTDDVQGCLSDLLTLVEGHGFLDETTVSFLLNKSCVHLTELVYLIDKLIELHAMDGLSRAIQLFELSSFDYQQDHFQVFCVVAEVFANPLCQTIFDARLRIFSDYSRPSEPVNSSVADTIIRQLYAEKHEENRSPIFFDFFAKLRPSPCSQKRSLEDIDVAAFITKALSVYCESEINAMTSREDYMKTKQMIRTLRMNGGNEDVFNRIKNSVGSEIEATDLYSSRNYKELMEEIWQELSKPQVNMDSFIEQLEATTVYREMATTSMSTQGLLKRTPSTEKASTTDTVNTLSKSNG